jgi:hypothetical protein
LRSSKRIGCQQRSANATQNLIAVAGAIVFAVAAAAAASPAEDYARGGVEDIPGYVTGKQTPGTDFA